MEEGEGGAGASGGTSADAIAAAAAAAAVATKKKKDGTLWALLRLSLPDLPLLSAAFLFLVLYAVAAASVPHFTGRAVLLELNNIS